MTLTPCFSEPLKEVVVGLEGVADEIGEAAHPCGAAGVGMHKDPEAESVVADGLAIAKTRSA